MKPILIIMILSAFLQSCKTASTLTTVNEVNIEKYSGLWYEIASYPTSFQKTVTAQLQNTL